MRAALLYNYLIEANIMASIAILLMLFLRKFLRRQLGNGALCFGWLLVAVRLLLPVSLPNPFIRSIRPPAAMDPAIRPIAGQIKVRVTDLLSVLYGRGPGFLREPSWQAEEAMYNGTLASMLTRVWLAGLLAVLAWFVFSNLRFRMKLRAGKIEPISGALAEDYRKLCVERGVKPVPVIFVDPLTSACLVGVLRPWIALPLTASPHSTIQVLTHEVCHLKNRDNWWNLLRPLCCALHWFNPLVWLAASLSRTDSELRCDDRVTASMDEEARKAYAGVLVLAASRRSAPGLGVLATGMTMTGRKLRARVQTVLAHAKPLRALMIGFMALAAVCLLGAFSTAETRLIPRIARAVTSFNRTRIADLESARAYARRIWASDELGRMDFTGTDWEVWEEDDEVPGMVIYYVQGQDGSFDTCFDMDGNLRGAQDFRSFGGWDWAAAPNAMTAEAGERLAGDLLAFLERFNPEIAQKAKAWTVADVYAHGDTVAADIAFWSSEAAMEREDDVVAYFMVEVVPETRVFYYNMNYGSLNGNG